MSWNNYALFLMALIVICSITKCIERNKKMNNYKEQKSGFFTAQDKTGKTVVLEWHKTNILSPELALFKKEMCDLAAQVTAHIEIQFLQVHPEAVTSGGFFRDCEPLFAQGLDNVNWHRVQQTIQSTIKQFYLMDMVQFGQEIINKLIDDVYFFVSVKDQKTQNCLGFMMTAITPALPKGDIKLINVVVNQQKQDRGLEQLLMSSIFEVLPEIKRIFTMIRPTNESANTVFESCGFVQDLNPIQDPNHPINKEQMLIMEYKADQSVVLQQTAKTLHQ